MNARLIVAIAIGVTGVVVALRALSRATPSHSSARGAAAGSPGTEAVTTSHPPDLPGWGELRFVTVPPDEALALVSEALNSTAASREVDMMDDERRWLVERSVERLRYIFEGSVSGFLDAANADGAVRTAPPEGLMPETVDLLNRWPEVWVGSPIDPQNVRIRMVDYGSDDALMRSLTPASARSSLQADYGPPPSICKTYEVVVPVMPLVEPGGSRRIKAFLAVSYDLLGPGGPWRPRGIWVYTAEHPGGRPLVAPPM